MRPRFLLLLLSPLLLLPGLGCAASTHRGTTPGDPEKVVKMEELRISARRGEGGQYTYDVYDAPDLFKHATELLNQKKCKEAVELYDRLVAEFAVSRYASAALYNGGLCLQALGEFEGAAERFGALRARYPESEDRKDASFQYAEVLVQLERWGEVVSVSDELLALPELSADERLEAMARRGQGLLGTQELQEAERNSRGALSYFRTRPSEEQIVDEFFAAACNYVLAETFRVRAQKMEFPEGQAAQQKVLVARAELLLEAQREYFNTISLTNLDNLHWAAASGYRIGHMYDELWHAIMNAPVPGHLPAEGHTVYHQELAKLVKPLIRHAIRYWELTLMMMERSGMQGSWADKTRSDLERVRVLMLDQPTGPGGLPQGAPPPQGAPEAS